MRGLGLSVRRFARRPGRGAAAALTLAVGIGATTAAFAAVDAVLLRDLPVDREEELVVGWRMDEERTSIPVPFRTEEYEFLSRGQRRLAGLAGFTAWGALPVLVENSATGYTLNEVRVAGDFFGVAGIRPAIGRLLTADDDRPGVAQVGVLSHRTWRTLFGSDPEVVGSSLSMRGRPVTVVGVGARGFDFPLGTDLWVPLQGEPFELHVIGRMAPGAGAAGVASDFSAVFSAGESQGLEVNSDLRPVVVPLRELIVGPVAPILEAASAAALLLLLAGTANGALFLLAAGRTAAHDLAVRKALGAGSGHLLSRLLADASLLAAFGSAGGLLLAGAALRILVPLAPPELPRLEAVSLGGTAWLFALAAGAVCAVTAGLSAWLVLSRLGDSRAAMAGGGWTRTASGEWFRRLVAGTQVGLAVTSVAGAGLLARTVSTIDRLDPGFSADGMTVVDLRIPYGFGSVPDAYMGALEAVVLDLEARPGVLAVRPTLGPPLEQRLEVALRAEEQGEDAARDNPFVAIDAVLPGHFEALGIRILSGRAITGLDNRADAAPVVVVDDVLARALWPAEDPIGKRVNGFLSGDTWFTVVGVVSGTRYRELLQPHPRAYYPLRRLGTAPPSSLLVRTTDAARGSVGDLVRDAFAAADPAVMVITVRDVVEVMRAPIAGRRFAAAVLLAFATAALLLAAVGVYAVFAVTVQERRHDLGVMRALGAQRSRIVALVLNRALRIAWVGALAGAAVALVAGRALGSLLFGVAPSDPLVLVAAVAGGLAAAVGAALPPAVRASMVDPGVALNTE